MSCNSDTGLFFSPLGSDIGSVAVFMYEAAPRGQYGLNYGCKQLDMETFCFFLCYMFALDISYPGALPHRLHDMITIKPLYVQLHQA